MRKTATVQEAECDVDFCGRRFVDEKARDAHRSRDHDPARLEALAQGQLEPDSVEHAPQKQAYICRGCGEAAQLTRSEPCDCGDQFEPVAVAGRVLRCNICGRPSRREFEFCALPACGGRMVTAEQFAQQDRLLRAWGLPGTSGLPEREFVTWALTHHTEGGVPALKAIRARLIREDAAVAQAAAAVAQAAEVAANA